MKKLILLLILLGISQIMFGQVINQDDFVLVEGGNINIYRNKYVYNYDYGELGKDSGVYYSYSETKTSKTDKIYAFTIDDFYLCKHEVTIKEWRAVVQAKKQNIIGINNYDYKAVWDYGYDGDNMPVSYVNWYEAMKFCNWLSEKEGLVPYYIIDEQTKDNNNKNSENDDPFRWTVTIVKNADGYRLPTFAEWRYAATGGKKTKGYMYSGSDDLSEIAWHKGNSDGKPHEVMQKKPNELGLYDMSGNVCEWCWDWAWGFPDSDYEYSHDFNLNDDQEEWLNKKKNPTGPISGNKKCLLGGGFRDLSYSFFLSSNPIVYYCWNPNRLIVEGAAFYPCSDEYEGNSTFGSYSAFRSDSYFPGPNHGVFGFRLARNVKK